MIATRSSSRLEKLHHDTHRNRAAAKGLIPIPSDSNGVEQTRIVHDLMGITRISEYLGAIANNPLMEDPNFKENYDAVLAWTQTKPGERKPIGYNGTYLALRALTDKIPFEAVR